MAKIPGNPKVTIVITVNVLIEISHPLSLLNTFMKNNTPIVKEMLNIIPVLLASTSLNFNSLPIYNKKSSIQRMVINQINSSTLHQAMFDYMPLTLLIYVIS